MHYIYELTFLKTREIYIGQTKDFIKRFSQHLNKPSGQVLNHCRNSDDWKFTGEVIFKSKDKSLIDAIEKRLIKETNCINKKRERNIDTKLDNRFGKNMNLLYDTIKISSECKITYWGSKKFLGLNKNTLKSCLQRLIKRRLIKLITYRRGQYGYGIYKAIIKEDL